MKATKLLGKLAAFVVSFLLVMLPVSVSAQLGGISGGGTSAEVDAQQPAQEGYGYIATGDADAQVFCWPWQKKCNDKCWSGCPSGKTWYCSSYVGGVCCDSSAKFCDSSAGRCWTDCPAGQKWNCGSSGAYCTTSCIDKDGDGYGSGCSKGSDCNDNDAGAYKNNVCGKCAKEPANYGKSCTVCNSQGCCATSKFICDNSGTGVVCPVTPGGCCIDKDGDGYGSGCSKGSDCNDNDAGAYKNNVCGKCAKEPANYGKSCTVWNGPCSATSAYTCDSSGTGVVCPISVKGPTSEVCNGVDDNCNGQVDEGLSQSQNCGTGACSGGTQTRSCSSGSWGGWSSCSTSNKGSSETCDGKDNDCDGQTDEGLSQSQSCGLGVCAGGTQTKSCSSGQWGNWGSCSTSNKATSETCNDGKDNDCDGQTDENCCPASKPNYWGGQCHECPSNNPYYCTRTGGSCWKSSTECITAQKCGSEGWSVCRDSNWPYWNCGSDGVSGCCPKGYPYLWNSDKQCHTSSEPKKCAVPDGSSANCDCDSNSDCPSNKPYCEENYPSPISDGHDGCVSAVPEYCGNGKCAGSETYSSCAADCSQFAPKGTVNVDVYYSSGSSKGKPVSGAPVYLDGVPKGMTDGSGKISFVASYGSRNVKVECPDGAFCAEKSVGVDGAKSVSFGCSCNPSTDSDGDGYTNEDEKLLGTNPKDANSNFATTFGSDSVDLLACVPTPVSFFILWKEYRKGGGIIQSHSLVVNSLNVTSVMSVSFEDKPYVVAEALAAAGFEAEGAEIVVNPVNVTLENVMKKAEYVDGVRMQDGILLIATDKDGQTTALIAIGAGCVGAFSGAVYGIGQGLFDDIKGVIDGIWFVITHLDDVKKVWSGAVELVNGIKELFSKPGEAFWSMFTGILKKGQGINLFSEGRLNQPEPYRHFQVGFVYGFVTGYLVEQVALGAAIFTKVAKAFKIGQLFGKTGKVTKLMEKLAMIRGAEEFGAEIAEKLGKLKYLKEGVENWLDSEIKGLARVMKHNEGWLKGLSEAEAKVAAKHADDLVAAGKISDAAFGDLVKTKLGQHTLKSADATTDLLAKQSRLVQKWGVSKADDVVSKGGRVAERTSDLSRILKAMPDNLVDDFDSGRAVKFLGDKKLVEAAEKLTKLCGGAGVGSLDYGPAAVQTCLTLFTKVDDFEDAVKGAKAVSAHIDNLDSIPKFVQDFPTKVEALADLGKLSDVTGVDKLAHDIAKVGGGHSHAARRAVILKETSDVKLLEVGKGVDVKIKYQGNEFVEKLDIDVFYERNIGGKKIRVMEEVKSKESGVIGASEEVQKDVLKMTKALEMGLADEAKIVTKGTFDVDVTRFIEQNGNKVQLVPGGIK